MPLPITFCVCSNRPKNVATFLVRQVEALGPEDHFLFVADTDQPAELPAATAALGGRLQVVWNRGTRGLSFGRNLAIAASGTKFLVFLDDDAVPDRMTVEAIRRAFADGSQVVGVRLSLPPSYRLPWFITDGQVHYLGVHGRHAPGRTWGACMGLDRGLALAHGLRFRDDLSRKGDCLVSGDDTTFVADMVRHGAREVFLKGVEAVHHVATDRLRFGYLLRRTYWQGRTERRRRMCRAGLRKEWARYTAGPTQPVRKYALAAVYLAAFVAGLVCEVFAGSVPVARSVSQPSQARPRGGWFPNES